MKVILFILIIVYMFLFVRFCRVCKGRESLWIFVLTAILFIPFNVEAIRSVMDYVEDFRHIRWFTKLALYPFVYMVMFCVEEIIFGVAGRMIWKKQYVLRWR